MVAWIPVVAIIAGALVYALAVNPKVAELGRLTFSCGMLVWLLQVAGYSLRLPH